MPRKQLAQVLDQILEIHEDKLEEVDSSTVEDYKKLNNRCDVVMEKIKNRKGNKTTQQTEG